MSIRVTDFSLSPIQTRRPLAGDPVLPGAVAKRAEGGGRWRDHLMIGRRRHCAAAGPLGGLRLPPGPRLSLDQAAGAGAPWSRLVAWFAADGIAACWAGGGGTSRCGSWAGRLGGSHWRWPWRSFWSRARPGSPCAEVGMSSANPKPVTQDPMRDAAGVAPGWQAIWGCAEPFDAVPHPCAAPDGPGRTYTSEWAPIPHAAGPQACRLCQKGVRRAGT